MKKYEVAKLILNQFLYHVDDYITLLINHVVPQIGPGVDFFDFTYAAYGMLIVGVRNSLPFLGPFGHFSIAYKYITT